MLLKILRMDWLKFYIARSLRLVFAQKKFFTQPEHKSALVELFLKLQSPRVDGGLMEATVENEGQK